MGADPKAGDGAGILIQLPHEFFADEAKALGFELPEPGHYGVAQLFTPRDESLRGVIETAYENAARQEGLEVIGWRDVPVNTDVLGDSVKVTEPIHRQCFIARGEDIADEEAFERKLFVARKVASNQIRDDHGCLLYTSPSPRD